MFSSFFPRFVRPNLLGVASLDSNNAKTTTCNIAASTGQFDDASVDENENEQSFLTHRDDHATKTVEDDDGSSATEITASSTSSGSKQVVSSTNRPIGNDGDDDDQQHPLCWLADAASHVLKTSKNGRSDSNNVPAVTLLTTERSLPRPKRVSLSNSPDSKPMCAVLDTTTVKDASSSVLPSASSFLPSKTQGSSIESSSSSKQIGRNAEKKPVPKIQHVVRAITELTWMKSQHNNVEMHNGQGDGLLSQANRIKPSHPSAVYAKGFSSGAKEAVAPSAYSTKASHAFSTSAFSDTGFKHGETSWEEQLAELQAFKQKYGHVNVLSSGDYQLLGRWLSNVRARFRRGAFPPEHAKILHDMGCIGFEAYPVSTEHPPEIKMTDNKESRNQPPLTRALHPKNPSGLAVPVPNRAPPTMIPREALPMKHRPTFAPAPGAHPPMQHPIGYATQPPPHRPPVPLTRRPPKIWHDRLVELGAFRKRCGHCNVTTCMSEEYRELGLWLASQRSQFRRGTLSSDRAFILSAHYGCKGFGEPYRHTSPSTNAAATGNLTHKGGNSDASGTRNTISFPIAGRAHAVVPNISAVNDGFVTETDTPPGDDSAGSKKRKRGKYAGWHDRLDALVAFREEYGHCEVRITINDKHKELGKWLASQRHLFRTGKLCADKVETLRNLGCNLEMKISSSSTTKMALKENSDA